MPKRNLIWLIVAALATLSTFLYFRPIPRKIVRDPRPADPAFAALRAAERLAREHYYRQIPTTAPEGAMRGFLAALDPYCRYVPHSQHDKLEQAAYGRRSELGLDFVLENGRAVVTGTMPGSAANQAGIRAKDVILEIDGRPLDGLSLSEISSLLSGQEDSETAIALSRPGAAVPAWTVRLKKQPYMIETVQGLFRGPDESWQYWLDEGLRIAYIRLREFAALTPEDMLKTLRPLMTEGDGMAGLILDLRGNPGGPLPQAICVAEMFLDSGLIVTIQRRGHDERYFAHRDRALPPIPLVVIVDAGTASAAELVAGALKARGRAAVVGQATAGKDLVQECYSLGEGMGEVLLTTGRFFFADEPNPAQRASPPGSLVNPHIEVSMDEPVAQELRQIRRRQEFISGLPPATQPSTASAELTWLIQDAPLRKALELLSDGRTYQAVFQAATGASSRPAE